MERTPGRSEGSSHRSRQAEGSLMSGGRCHSVPLAIASWWRLTNSW
jgi:hypothetical protein